jgi:hypothetical protein
MLFQLLMCDYKSCPKVYHMSCVDHETRPREKWICPWHHCVTCGKSATKHCIHCPNAYCKAHDFDLKDHPVLGRICNEHTDEFADILKFYLKTEGVARLVRDPNQPVKYVEKGQLSRAVDKEIFSYECDPRILLVYYYAVLLSFKLKYVYIHIYIYIYI